MYYSSLFCAILLFTSFFPFCAINPERVYKQKPSEAYHEYKVVTSDNIRINVWEYIPKTPNQYVIIVAGGDAGNMGYVVRQSEALVSRNFRIVSFDYRGFGGSSDFLTNHNYLFYNEYGLDLMAVFQNTKNKFPNAKIGVYGISMGTYVTLMSKVKIDFFVADGFFQNPNRMKRSLKRLKSKEMIVPKLDSSFVVTYPSLIFCGVRDSITSVEQAQDFSKKNKAKVVKFSGSHLEAFTVLTQKKPGDIYIDYIDSFINSIK
jgi:alpha-beta hydrolase superfamily lysophospholipase